MEGQAGSKMKNSKLLEELKRESKKNVPKGATERLAIGENYWLWGCPITSVKGVIALRLQSGHTVEIREEDVMEVKKVNDDYLVQVKAGTNILTKVELVSQVNPSAAGGSCTETDDTTKTVGQELVSPSDSNFPDDIFEPPRLGVYTCYMVPEMGWECRVWRDKCGEWHRICFPVIRYHRVCRWF